MNSIKSKYFRDILIIYQNIRKFNLFLLHKFFIFSYFFSPKAYLVGVAYFVSFFFGLAIIFASSTNAQSTDEQTFDKVINNESNKQQSDEKETILSAKIVPGFVDIPMHPELSYKPEDVTIFDSPDGIVHETRTFSMTANKDDIINFYLENLPPLGWVFSAKTDVKLEFLRDTDFLWIGVYLGKNGGLIVDFFQVPDTFSDDDASIP